MIYYLGEEDLPFEKCSMEDVLDFCNSQSLLAIDTETTELHPQIGELLLLQIGNEDDQYVIDVRTESILPLKPILESVPLVAHNFKFDLRWLFKEGIYPYLNLHDTFINEHVITSGYGFQHSYAYCCDKYLEIKISKEERNLFRKSIINETTVAYGARDVKHLIPLKREQDKIIRREKLGDTVELESLYVPVMAYIEDCGMLVDQKQWSEKIERDIQGLNASLDQLDADYFKYSKVQQSSLFGNADINWGSHQQVLKFVHDLNINPVDKDGKPTTSSKVLAKFRTVHPFVDSLLTFRKHEKNCSTYGESFLALCNGFPDKRIRTSFRQILKTGRTGSGASEGGESSVKEANLQNIPKEKETRGCFVPETGNVFVVADYSQQEQNILANQSENPALLEFFRSESTDMHSFVVRKMHPELIDLTDKEIKDLHPEKRDRAKTCGFASNYGGNGITVAHNLGLSEEEGIRIYEAYINSFPGLFDYFRLKEIETLKNGYILTNYIVKRRIFLKEIKEYRRLAKEINWIDYREQKALDSDRYKNEIKPLVTKVFKLKSTIRKASMNAPVQSTGADMMKRAGIAVFHWILENGFFGVIKIVNIIHDEYVLECPKDLSSIVSEKVEEAMLVASQPFCDLIPMGLSIKETLKWEH